DDLEQLEKMGKAGAWIARTSRPWLEQWEKNMRTPGFNPFDTLAIAYETHPELLSGYKARLTIREGVDERATAQEQAAGSSKPYLWAEPDDASPHIYLTTPREQFHEILLERLGGASTEKAQRPAP